MVVAVLLMVGCTAAQPDDVALRYAQALRSGDFAAFKGLWQAGAQRALNENVFRIMQPEKVEVVQATACYITLCYRLSIHKNRPEQMGTVYLLPDGKVKYDPIFLMHPALYLRGLLPQLQSGDLQRRQSALWSMEKMKIPAYGFAPDAALEQRAQAIVQIQQWIDKNEATFDCGDPKIPLSAVDLQKARALLPKSHPATPAR